MPCEGPRRTTVQGTHKQVLSPQWGFGTMAESMAGLGVQSPAQGRPLQDTDIQVGKSSGTWPVAGH